MENLTARAVGYDKRFVLLSNAVLPPFHLKRPDFLLARSIGVRRADDSLLHSGAFYFISTNPMIISTASAVISEGAFSSKLALRLFKSSILA